LKAEILLDYSDRAVARTVLRAISPDNFKTPRDLLVKSTWKDGTVITMIEARTKLPTLIATIDDLLFCVSVAEKTVSMVKELKKLR
jgi:hypothetical protein